MNNDRLRLDVLLEDYALAGTDRILTPALLIYQDIVAANIAATISLLGGNPNRWRPHVKTAKLAHIIRLLIKSGVTRLKCATTLELLTACEAGGTDVLFAHHAIGPKAIRVIELARQWPGVRVSALVDDVEQIQTWRGTPVGLFVDINPGMDRTGISTTGLADIFDLVRAIETAGVLFRGFHYYDGHLAFYSAAEVESIAHAGYDRLLAVVTECERRGVKVEEIITSGTPAFPWTLSYQAFASPQSIRTASPGTVVYGDATSLNQVPVEAGYRPAALVLSTVISHPASGILTCDAGHKTVSADAGVPTCVVVGRPDLRPLSPSEEHLPMAVGAGGTVPSIGSVLYLLPRHVCPTVNNFDHALIISKGRIVSMERVSARGREAPMTRHVGMLSED